MAQTEIIDEQNVVKTTSTVTPAVTTEPVQRTYQKKKAIFRTYQVIWYILGFIEVLLGFRVILKALAANPDSGFASLIYGLSDPFARPFAGIFGLTISQGSVMEWSTLMAAIVYLIGAYGIVQLIQLIKPTTPEEVELTVNNP